MSNLVLFEELPVRGGQRIAIATLNAEKSLNALTLDMIRLLDARLSAWENDDAVVAVLLRGAGDKAFCAGGDVRSLRAALLEDGEVYPNPHAVAFFSEEYRLDYRIHRYRKPLIVWGGGIVMGGGLGLMAGASHRVATPATRIAMPEITIGLYPDVAGSWFLQRMPAKLGLFLGLTGAPLNAGDALLCNLADHVLPADGQTPLLTALRDLAWEQPAERHHGLVSALLNEMERDVALPEANAGRNLLAVHQLMNRGSLEAVAAALRDTAFEDPWLAGAAKSFAHGCPTSAAVCWEIFQRAKHLSLAEVLRMELALSVNFCAKPDFREGVRALLVDKDRAPQWHCRELGDIPPGWVDSHFDSPWTEADHPLAALQ
ncbi:MULTISPECIES: enoyl-CoA hydratase/isomerase family protein [Chromobacterium]|uniref:enoyl-CoA hydratase/isomerase family protein n=1 Tax=Chromobacterium TaxID=535 RepID=UPI001D07254B|nr:MULTISPECIES: enoyl-CoA hydratase/isomerase family protein [Chromobacterium]UJB30900.1 enoyl-CoA hydratase/isomerase family protein [Chromobacterium sp. Beijing]